MILSIIITHHNTPELLDLCLQSIKNTVKKIEHEIIVVDSEAQERTQELLQEKYPKAKLIPFKKNVGYSKIVNVGLKKAKGDFILILNADIIVLEEAVSKMLKYIKKHDNVGIIGPQLIDFTGNVQNSSFAFPDLGTILARRTFLGKTKWGKRKVDKFIQSVDWVQGSAMMIRKSALKRVGLLDDRFFMYFEDTDWCRRFWQKGYKVVYLPAAKMAHYYHRTSKRLGPVLDIVFNRYARIHIISALKYFWKYRSSKSKTKTQNAR